MPAVDRPVEREIDDDRWPTVVERCTLAAMKQCSAEIADRAAAAWAAGRTVP